MGFQVYSFFIQVAIFSSHCNFIFSKPMFGQNIRLANEKEFPYVTSIMIINNTCSIESNHDCTGVLISKHNVATSAHCLVDKDCEEMKVIIGSTDLELGREYQPMSWVTYDDWARFHKMNYGERVNDIGIIQLILDVPDIQPVPLWPTNPENLYGSEIVVVGWGMTHTGKISKHMETAVLKVLSYDDCIDRYLSVEKLNGFLTTKYLCTIANPYVVMGDGNSGGPILFNGALVAIHKGTILYAQESFHPNKINIHLTIHYYKEFVNDIINNY